jgi:hypothetical protein
VIPVGLARTRATYAGLAPPFGPGKPFPELEPLLGSDASERALLKEFRDRLGDQIRIELRYVESIPREPNGKLRAVKSAVGRLA